MSPSKSRRRRRPRKTNNNKKIITIVAVFAVVAAIIVGYIMLGTTDTPIETTSKSNSVNDNANETPESNSINDNNNENTESRVTLVTSMGNIVIELRDDMPITTENFKNLIQQGVYDNTTFHRVVNLPQNLVMIQGGDPNGNGFSDDGIPSIPDEFSDIPENNKNERGTIAMANAGANTGSSQFFINGAYNSHLDNVHPVFGDVIEGMDVVDQILNVETDQNNKPITLITVFTADFE